VVRAIVGLVKGLLVGGGIGYGLVALGWTGAVWVYLACALVGALVGVVCGRAPWRSETIWTPVVKMIVGAIIGVGLCALGRRFVPDVHLATVQALDLRTTGGTFLAATIGVLYGVFVEIDDGGRTEKEAAPAGAARKK
jgi:hypothetical protein